MELLSLQQTAHMLHMNVDTLRYHEHVVHVSASRADKKRLFLKEEIVNALLDAWDV